MNFNKPIYLIVIIVHLSLSVACRNNNEKNISATIESQNIYDRQKSMILNKQIKTLKKIIVDSVDLCNNIILIYNGFDCESCIDIGYEIAKKMDSLANKQIVHVISTSSNIGKDQFRNNYLKYVYKDENDLIRRELKYIYTPIMLKVDSLYKIRDVYFLNYNRDLNLENEFITRCIYNLNN